MGTFLPGSLSLIISTAALSIAAGPVFAQSLDFNGASASNVVAQLGSRYGIHVVLKSGIRSDTPVTFSIADASSSDSPLMAVNELANALHGDYQKVFVVSKANQSTTSTSPVVDTSADITFTDRTVPAQTAITDVANVDAAAVQFGTPVDGTVTFSSTTLPARQAAREIAEQTHTRWKAFYAIVPKTANAQSAQVPAGAKIVDRTRSGQPITQLPFSVYTRPPAKSDQGTDATAVPVPLPNPPSTAVATEPGVIVPPAVGYGYPPDYGYNFYNGNGYGGYGGYGNGGYGFGNGFGGYGNGGYGFGGYGNGGYGFGGYGNGGYGFGGYGNGGYGFGGYGGGTYGGGGVTVLPGGGYGGGGPIIIP